MLGATLEDFTNMAKKGVSTLGKSHKTIVIGGSNDTSKHEANIDFQV
jgi:hypothetical protein